MATLTSARVAASYPVHERINGVTVATASLAVATTLGADTIQMVKVPKGARILDVALAATDIDTATGILMTVGDTDGTDDTDRYITSSNIGQAGGVARLNNQAGHLYEFTADGTVDITVTVAATTPAAGTLTLVVTYTVDDVA